MTSNTISEIRKDGVKNIYVFNNQNKNSSMTDILMETISGFKNYIRKFKPDLTNLSEIKLKGPQSLKPLKP